MLTEQRVHHRGADRFCRIGRHGAAETSLSCIECAVAAFDEPVGVEADHGTGGYVQTCRAAGLDEPATEWWVEHAVHERGGFHSQRINQLRVDRRAEV